MTYPFRWPSGRTATIVLLTALSCMAVSPTLSARELVSGNPPLTSEMADQAANCTEWLLGTSFTAEQRQKYQQALVDNFRSRDKGAIDGVLAIINLQNKLASLSEPDRAAMRGKLQAEFLKFLRANSRDEGTRFLLNVYESAPNRTPAGTPGPAQPAGLLRTSASPRTAPALLGKWYNGRVFSTYYRDRVTGSFAPGSGTRFTYEFHADGTYIYTGMIQSTSYNCTSTTFSEETGTYAVDGDLVSTRPERNQAQQTNSCAPSSNKSAPGKLINTTYRFRAYAKDQQTYLELANPDGSGASSYSREK